MFTLVPSNWDGMYDRPWDHDEIDEPDPPTWVELYDPTDELPGCGNPACDGTCDTCINRQRRQKEAEQSYLYRLNDEDCLCEAMTLGHPYSYIASHAVQHGDLYFFPQSDWYEYITPSIDTTLSCDEIPF